MNFAAVALASLMAVWAVSTTHFASRSIVAASTGPATHVQHPAVRGAEVRGHVAALLLALPTILNVATFWNDETKYSLTYLPTSSFASAPTRSARRCFR